MLELAPMRMLPTSPWRTASMASRAFLDGGEGALGVRHEGDAGVGERDAAAGALEQPLADFPFERLDARRHRWLREEQRFGRAAKRTVVRHLEECFELCEFHPTLVSFAKEPCVDCR